MKVKVKVKVILAMLIGQACLAPAQDAANEDAEVIAVVLGKEITSEQQRRMRGLILNGLLRKFATEQEIKPTPEELDFFVDRMEQLEKEAVAQSKLEREKLIESLKAEDLTDERRKDVKSQIKGIEEDLKITGAMMESAAARRPMRRMMAQEMVIAWKTDLALYTQYGGRVRFQQSGAEPLDAYREFLKEQEKKGAFKIHDPERAAAFWEYFDPASDKDFFKPEKADEAMRTPWWMQDMPNQG